MSPHLPLLIIEFALPSLALGKLLLLSPRLLPAPRATRLLVGVGLGPFFLSLCVLSVVLAMPGAPAPLLLGTPLVLAAIGLLLIPGAALPALANAIRRSWMVGPAPRLNAFIWLGALVIAVLIARVLIANGQAMVTGEDALKYLEEALAFARERRLGALPDFHGELGASVPSSAHSAIYQLLLALALLCSPGESLGYPNDLAARATVQILIVYLFLATAALGQLARRPGAGPLAAVALACAVSLWGFSMVHTRDAYRILALVLFAVTLFAGGGERRRRVELPLLAVTAACAVLAHTVNLSALALVMLAYVVVTGSRRRWRALVRSCVAVAVGGAIGAAHYAHNLLSTGKLFGLLPNEGFRDTAAWQAIAGDARFTDAATLSVWQRFTTIFAGQGLALSVAGLGAAIAICLLARSGRDHAVPRAPARHAFAVLTAAAVLALYLPVLGLLDALSTLPYSSYLTTNMRYMAHLQPFAAALLAYAALELASRSPRGRAARASRVAGVVLIAGIVATATHTVATGWQVLPAARQQAFAAMVQVMNATIGTPPGVVLVGRDYIRYYLRARTADFGYPRVWALLRETDPNRIPALLDRLEVSHVMVEEARALARWDRLALLRYLEDSPRVARATPIRGLRIYRLSPPTPGD